MEEDTKDYCDRIYQSRIEELLTELSDCKEDERNAQNQILQVISVVGTILSILFGISFFDSDNKNMPLVIFQSVNSDNVLGEFCNFINQNVTYSRVMFWLGLLVFVTAFAYIVVLGVTNILRYYYIQTIEDRLYEMISSGPDDKGRGLMLHWNAYIAPIITRNPKHITSSHTALNYCCYTIAIVSIVIFSMGMVASLFQQINPRMWFDTLLLLVVLGGMALTVVLFLRLSSHAEEVAQIAWDTGHDNQKIRVGAIKKEPYEKAKSFRRMFWYLLYPKKQDLQKPALIVVGFICGLILSGIKIGCASWGRLLFVLFVFDFLAYQARYQINDIRGIEEDKDAGWNNRLIAEDTANERHSIKISAIIAFIKMITAFLLTIFVGGELKKVLLISLGILFVSTMFYEMAKKKGNASPIYLFVGMGYPLRFFVGFFAVAPEVNLEMVPQMLCVIIALWAYGSLSSILSWIGQISSKMSSIKLATGSIPSNPKFKKKHFANLYNLIKPVDCCVVVNGKFMPLREKRKFNELWNMIFLTSLLALMFTAYLGNISESLLMVEAVVCIAFSFNGCLKGKNKLYFMGAGWFCILVKAIMAVMLLDNFVWYLVLCGIQILVTFTYFILCYQPQMKVIKLRDLIKGIVQGCLKLILGEYAADRLNK